MSSQEHDAAFVREFPALAEAIRKQFVVERELGRGGMGVVYLARDEQLDRLVALKVLPALLAMQPDTRERFLREARTAARLAHPNVVPIYRADEAGGTAFFAMAFVDGETLADRLRDRGPLSPADAVPILRSVAWALAYAHAHGVVHRDVKPENILLERATGRTLVTDFGIAHRTLTDESARLTQDGHVLGTLHYMSPEQVNGVRLDGRSDLYALGVVAFQTLSGRLPFDGMPMAAVLVAHATRPAPSLRDVAPGVPVSLAAVVDRCLAKQSDDRYPTGEALADALERALAEAPAPLRTAGPALPAGLPERLDEQQAAAIWRRAAQLQADALHRVEARESLHRIAPAESSSVADAPTASYRLTDVASAAEEAGISQQYVAMALAELPRGTLPTTAAAALGVSETQATRFLGTDARSIAVTVEMAAPPTRALRAIGAVLQRSPYELKLRATVGSHPLDGGVLVFDLPGEIMFKPGTGSGTNSYWMNTHQYLEGEQVQVTMRPVSEHAHGPATRTLVTMTADIRPGVRRNVRASQWLGASFASMGAAAAVAVMANAGAAFVSAAVVGPSVGVAAAMAGLSIAAYRKFYPYVLRKAEGEMRSALDAVAAALHAEQVFGSMPGAVTPGPRSPSDGDDGASFLPLLG